MKGLARITFSVLAIGLVAAMGLVAVQWSGGGSTQPAHADHVPPTLDPLARSAFTDEVRGTFFMRLEGTNRLDVTQVRDASDIVVVKVTVPPHSAVPWHTHPGPALVAIAEGELTITYAGECLERGYATGEAFLDTGKLTHRADNFGDVDVVAYVTFLGIPEGAPATIPAPEDFDSGC